MKIYTKRGDLGQTDLFGGERVAKSDDRVVAYGLVDYANSMLGLALAQSVFDEELNSFLRGVMSDLFDIGAELSIAKSEAAKIRLGNRLDSSVGYERIKNLEDKIDKLQEELPDLTTFVLPTGTVSAARFHLARVQVRRAEQHVVLLRERKIPVRDEILVYLNRLSDFCFVLARYSNKVAGTPDIMWHSKKNRN